MVWTSLHWTTRQMAELAKSREAEFREKAGRWGEGVDSRSTEKMETKLKKGVCKG